MKILALIPARGGSKRIPEKNIRELNGKPLLAYTIEHARSSKFINRIIVSTDNESIAGVAKNFGAELPFIRPIELAQDETTDLPVFVHALNWLKENEGYVPDIVVHLRPTSPLRKVEDVDKAIDLLINHPEVDSVRTVIEPASSPYKMYNIENNLLVPLLKIEGEKESYNLGDQKLPKVYRHIGTADVMWSKTITEKGKMSGDKILPLIVDKAYSGINTPEDWEYYEFLVNKNK
jgi:CMP-N,N'-diacetyllegionaminic acid synthase